MTKGLLKSSKGKQKLYENFLIKITSRNESIYKAYKFLFESLKKIIIQDVLKTIKMI